jgi:hypothetical protein
MRRVGIDAEPPDLVELFQPRLADLIGGRRRAISGDLVAWRGRGGPIGFGIVAKAPAFEDERWF